MSGPRSTKASRRASGETSRSSRPPRARVRARPLRTSRTTRRFGGGLRAQPEVTAAADDGDHGLAGGGAAPAARQLKRALGVDAQHERQTPVRPGDRHQPIRRQPLNRALAVGELRRDRKPADPAIRQARHPQAPLPAPQAVDRHAASVRREGPQGDAGGVAGDQRTRAQDALQIDPAQPVGRRVGPRLQALHGGAGCARPAARRPAGARSGSKATWPKLSWPTRSSTV